MKKSKFVLLSFVLIVLLSFSLFFIPVGVKAASGDELYDMDIEEIWEEAGLPLSAIDYEEEDGKGIMFFVRGLWEINESGFIYYLAYLVPVRDYYFDDGYLDSEDIYVLPYNIFFSDSLLNMLSYYSDTYGVIVEGNMAVLIPDWDRMVIIWDVEEQKFVASNYLLYWIDTSFNDGQNVGYTEGYDVGYGEGHVAGYQEGIIVNHEAAYYEGYNKGYDAGYNVGYDAARPNIDILLITFIMFIVSVFVYFKFRLRWVLIATTLLWFVPIFLVENLFIKIFSVIMIIATIAITFFSEREDDYE